MRLHETFRIDNAAIPEAFQHDAAVVKCQLHLLWAMEELAAAVESGDEAAVAKLNDQIGEIIPRRNALLLPYQERAAEEDREIRESQFQQEEAA